MFGACGDDGGSTPGFENLDCDAVTESATCVEIATAEELLEAAVLATPDTTLLLSSGTFVLANAVTIRQDGVRLVGQGIAETVLSFSAATTQFNGVDVVGDDFLVQDLTVLDAPKDGIRVEESDGVTFRRIRATWTNPDDSSNGAYGIYPVKSQNVLVEDSFAENASDAGLYVGQCQNVIVRRNTVRGNVAGLEIENTQFADVYENLAEDNTGGVVVFDLPGNPIVGRDVRIRNNTIRGNNNANFAPSGTVGLIPAGTGTFALASRRVEITNNTYENNQTVDIALLSGLIVEDDPTRWELEESMLVGQWDDLGLMPGATAGTVMNFRTENIVVAGNTHSGSGTEPDISREMGLLVAAVYGSEPIDAVVYDALGESMFDAEVAANNSNDNHICVGGNTMGSFGSLDVETQASAPGSPILSLDTPPFAPFDCTTLDGGPVADVVLP
jgi:parallel beta-helix repeat protein